MATATSVDKAVISISLICQTSTRKFIKAYDKLLSVIDIISDVFLCKEHSYRIEVSHDERGWAALEDCSIGIDLLCQNFNVKYIKITCIAEEGQEQAEHEVEEQGPGENNAFSLLMKAGKEKVALPAIRKSRYIKLSWTHT